jgi:glycosyltransferase involved in cell wall biosynthesis
MIQSKIKIIHIIPALDIGGAEKLLFDLVNSLNKEKYEVMVATVVRGGILVKNFEEAGIPVQIFKKKTKLGLGVLWKIYRYLRKENPQIVHTHLFGGDTWGRIAAILARTPIIVSTEHNTNFDEKFIKRIVKKFLSYFTDKIIAVSEAVRKYSISKDYISEKKIEVIFNGINLEKFLSISQKEFGEPPIIGIVGRLAEQKGHKYLFESLNLLKTIPWTLWVVGDGPKKAELERLSKDLDLRERILFLGAQENIPDILDKIDIFVLPSLWEGLGLAVIEAAAAAKPIVATNVGGIPEIIEDEKTGLLVEPGNVKSLADGLERVILGEGEALVMGRAARECVREKFGAERMVKKYEELYEKLMDKNYKPTN